MKTVLITGIAGFIGSHICVEVAKYGYHVIGIDNFCNSKREVIYNIEKITGKKLSFYEGDVRNGELLCRVFEAHAIDAVIHLAGLKAVGESVSSPLAYYDNNVGGVLKLIKVMNQYNCKKMVFSSSATVYGLNNPIPYKEEYPLSATSPYGTTKIMSEQILKDICSADKAWSVMLLRYFNPIGAHESGLIGEDPDGEPNNLFPYISRVAAGKLSEIKIFGRDYDTVDGTGVRDYIHICDLAEGHLAALQYILENTGAQAINLGTGKGTSVLQLIETFEKACGKTLNKRFLPRRAGDIAEFYADSSKAQGILNWIPKKDLDDMCRDGWHYAEQWEKRKPQ